MPIHQLSQSVINKIAAGEVIERPASVIKELVENSLDAGSTRIDVAVEQGGMELLRVADNGGGIPAEELPLAIASHATSKLTTADDLFSVRTLGFRGEALASIAEVSRFLIRSRQGENAAGAQLEVNAGQVGEVSPAGCPPGTTVEVRNLFFNTPVRRKFLRTPQTEMSHISETITRMALAHPHVHFTLRHNNREVYDLPPSDDWAERIALFFGSELATDLLWIESADENIKLRGYVAKPSQSRSQPKMQYLFLNGRFIRDRSLQHALTEAYRGLLLTGRYPISFLHLELPPDMVDVNVHPTKLEVRFQDGGRIYSQLLGTLRTKFLTTDLTHKLSAAGAESPGSMTGADSADPATQRRAEFADWARQQTAAWDRPTPTASDQGAIADRSAAPAERQPTFDFPTSRPPLDINRLPQSWGPSASSEPVTAPSRLTPVAAIAAALGEAPAAGSARALQIHNRYLVAESEEGVMIIDQHALHERILYEQLREKVLAGALETQNLLVPEPVDLTPAEAALVLQQRELLAQLGVKIEPFGGDTVLVSSYPAMLSRLSPVQVLRDLVDQLAHEGQAPNRRDVLDELLHMMSCKAAIKAGDRLTPDEVSALLEQRHLAQDTHHCPHGRPTALVFTRDELDKQFMRT